MDAGDRFEESYRAWAERRTALETKRVLARLPGRTGLRFVPQSGLAWAGVAAIAGVLAGSAVWWSLRPVRPLTVQAGTVDVPMDAFEEVIVWVDEETPVHVILSDASARGSE